MSEDEERAYRQKVLGIGFVIVGTLWLMATGYATQMVAAECEYNTLLGFCVNVFDVHIYPPWQYWFWKDDPKLVAAIPRILGQYRMYPLLALLLGAGFTYLVTQGMKKQTSHGSSEFASKKDIDNAGLGEYNIKEKTVKVWRFNIKRKEKQVKDSGVGVGVNPFTKKLRLHDGPEHLLLMAPTGQGNSSSI